MCDSHKCTGHVDRSTDVHVSDLCYSLVNGICDASIGLPDLSAWMAQLEEHPLQLAAGPASNPGWVTFMTLKKEAVTSPFCHSAMAENRRTGCPVSGK